MQSKNNGIVDNALATYLRLGSSDVKSFMIVNDRSEGCSIQPNGCSSINIIVNKSVLKK